MHIFRVEDRRGEGPYNGENQLPMDILLGALYDDERNPAPKYDLAGWDKHDHSWHFGFPTMQALQRWFALVMPILPLAGFHAAEYEVPDSETKCSTKQCAFHRYAAKHLKNLPLQKAVNEG